MKNFQQTPRQLRLKMTSQKAAFQQSKPKVFQPREAWSNKRTVNGVALSVLDEKQYPRRAYHQRFELNWPTGW